MTKCSERRGRLPAFALLLALLGSLIPMSSVYALIAVTGIGGGTGISVDNFATGTYTAITGPSMRENLLGDFGNGTLELDLPAGIPSTPRSAM